MANLLITNYCNRNCLYCFASREVSHSRDYYFHGDKKVDIDLSALDKVIRFFKRSEITKIGIMGGEPTLHPQFPKVIDKLLGEGLDIKLFTGGLVPRRAIDYLKTLDPKKLTILINVSSFGNPLELKRIKNSICELSKYAVLAYTIHELDFNPSFLIDWIKEKNCRPYIRLGIGLPIVNATHPLIHPRQYKTIAQHILRLAERCDKNNISLKFDCGFTFCMFTPEELGYLCTWNCGTHFCCSSILDIGPNLDVWPCFPLSPMIKTHLDEFETQQDILDFFSLKTQNYRFFGVYDSCHTCKYKQRKQCAGGCLSHTIRCFNYHR